MAENDINLTDSEVDNYLMLSELLNSIYLEMKELSKKKPDEPLNKFKVSKINLILFDLTKHLTNEPTAKYLEVLDNESLPTNSDAILIIGQFKAAMKRYKDKNTNPYGKWFTVENFPHGR